MKTAILFILLMMCLSGCAGMLTKWECATGSCLSREQATNKCLAQANSAFSRNKSLIWEQCMRGEGFQEVQCAEYERNKPDCQILHVL